MNVSLLDFVEFPLPEKQKYYQAITKQIRYMDSIIETLKAGNDGIKEDLDNPNFGMNTNGVSKELIDAKQVIIDACISKIKKELPSIYLNENLLTKAGMLMKPFDARSFMNFMRKQYADVDFITLTQWQYAIIDEMVPARINNGDYLDWKLRTIEHIKDIDSAGIELYFRGNHFTNEELLNIVVKFSKFVFGNYSSIPEIEGFPMLMKEMDTGKAYTTSEFKSIRFYNGDKHRLKLGFKNANERALFKEMLFTHVYKLLNREEPEAPELKDACDICLFKEISCMDCIDYSLWAGSCNFCRDNKNYPRYLRMECDNCKTGRRTEFIPILAVQKLPGLMKEDGYCHHVWKARKFRKNPILKVHCWGWGVKGAYYKHYTKITYPTRTCINCHNCRTETQEDDINNVCKSEKSVLNKDIIYIYNYKN